MIYVLSNNNFNTSHCSPQVVIMCLGLQLCCGPWLPRSSFMPQVTFPPSPPSSGAPPLWDSLMVTQALYCLLHWLP